MIDPQTPRYGHAPIAMKRIPDKNAVTTLVSSLGLTLTDSGTSWSRFLVRATACQMIVS